MIRRLVFAFLLAAISDLSTAWAVDPPFPPALTRFDPYCGNPVFDGAGPGNWDAKIRERGWILRDGDRWRLWYTGYDGTKSGRKLLGVANSTDGLNWSRDLASPLDDAGYVEDMMIVPHDGRLYMFAEDAEDRAQLLVSDDGLGWQNLGRLDIRRTSGDPIDHGPYGTPTAFVKDGLWHLFYERGDRAVWLATSSDLRVWTNVSDDPVLRPGPDAYDSSRIALNQIVEHAGRYYALYHGTNDLDSPALWTSNLAVSDDLRVWTKYSDNPLFPKAANRSSNILVPTAQGRFRLYTMHDKVEAFISTSPLAGP